MDNRKIFRVNQPLEVFNPGQNIYYKSIIQELADDHIVIGVPLRRRRQMHLTEGIDWDFRLTMKDSLYYFRSSCLGQRGEGRLLLFMIARPVEVKRIQRRRHYRISCSFDAYYRVFIKPPETSPETSVEQTGAPRKAVVVDISGGGLQIVTSERLPAGSVLHLTLYLKSKERKKIVDVKAKVVWQRSFRQDRNMLFRHALQYVDISERLREKIVGFIFVLMRERLI